jgi:recombinational DNA repair protein RecR
MSLAEKLLESFNKLPEEQQKEVIDFAMFLNQKKQRDIELIMDEIISENHEALEELGK